ncbi:MAG TPA: ABC transporter ATP-binding protein, partial [Bryobacteraceae bacterium]|nr:ABC transporter ATP-binding protein [Bryobacteraceae bacterium]
MEEEVLGKAYDARLMRRLFRYLRPYRLAVAGSLVLLLLLSVLQVAGPLLTKIAVDRYLLPTHGRTALDPWLSANPWTGLTEISLLFLLVLVSMFVLDFAQSYIMQWTGQQAMFDLRRDLMAHLQRLDLAFYDRTPVGRMLTRVTTDVDALNELLASGLVTILGDVLMLAFVFAVMLKLDVPLTLTLAAILPAVVAVTVVFRRRASQSYRRIRVAIARINTYLQEHLTGMTVLQLFNREQRSSEEFEEINRIHMEAFKDAI